VGGIAECNRRAAVSRAHDHDRDTIQYGSRSNDYDDCQESDNKVTTIKTRSSHVRWRTVALPTEHGGWGFISEPILLGLLLAPTWGGLALGIAAFAAFLLRHPLKLYIKDIRAGRRVPRTLAARRFVLIYSGVMIAAAMLMVLLMSSLIVLVPIGLSIPLIGMQFWRDIHNKGRSLTAELAGAIATGAFASSIVLIDEWTFALAMGLWLALAAKGVTAVLYVRSRLRLERDKPASRLLTISVHVSGVLLLLVATAYALLPWTAPLAMVILAIRAGIGLSSLRKARPAKVIGIQEMIYGSGFVLLVVLGYSLK